MPIPTPVKSPQLNLRGMALSNLKEKASVIQDPSTSLIDYIKQAHYVYRAAAEADEQGLNELAYVEYFKSAGILQIILNHPGFKTLRSQQPDEYRSYTDIAPKILASTGRAKQLGQIIESSRRPALTPTSPNSNAIKSRHIGGGISSRIKILEAAGLSRSGLNSTPNPLSPSSTDKEFFENQPSFAISQSPRQSITAFQALPNGSAQSSFVKTALETQSAIRSGSAPPELTIDQNLNALSMISESRSGIGIGRPTVNGNSSRYNQNPSPSDDLLEKTLLNLRSPSEFAHAFPVLEDLSLSESDFNKDGPYVDLPSVPRTMPVKSLPPPPAPFQMPPLSPHLPQPHPKQSYQIKPDSDQLNNDTTLGAGLTINTSLDSNPGLGAPPPYPDVEKPFSSSSKPAALTRSRAIRNIANSRSSSDRDSSPSSPARLRRNSRPTDGSPLQDPPTLPEGSNEILPAVLMDYFRKSAAVNFSTNVLFLDLRERDDFESIRIKSNDVVCIEPLVLTKNGGKGVSSQEIEQSLVLSPRKEQLLFGRRHEFDHVIIYDKRSIQLPIHRPSKELLFSQDPTETSNKRLLLLYLAIHQEELIKPLKRSPVLLSGGIEGWIKVAGEAGIVGKGSAPASQRRGSQTTNFNSVINGTSVTLRQPPMENDSLSSESVLENSEESSQIKKARRQVALVQNEGSPALNGNFIARSVADLTRPSSNPSSSSPNSYSQTFQHRPPPPPPPPPPLSNINYTSPNGISSPITLPQQTLQRTKSTQPFENAIPPQPPESMPSYASKPPVPLPNSSYHQNPHVLPPPPNYSIHQPQFIGSRPVESSYSPYLQSTSIRPSITYPQIQTMQHHITPRPLQPPPPALTPGGGSTPLPSYYNQPSTYLPSNQRPAPNGRDMLSIQQRETPPVTPYSPNRHGPSEFYFNPSFEDGTVGLTGLKNLGNTCYMNSTLQCISATIPLARFFKDGSYKRCINRSNPLGTQGQLAESVAELVRVLWGAQYTFVSPITFREAICRFAPQFRGSDQHDAQEFLGFLLDGLHEDLNLVINKPKPIEMTKERELELENLPTQLASQKEWEIYKRRDNSVIVELFQGQYRSRLQCLTCGTTSTTYNTFMYLSLPIPHKRSTIKVTLTQCLDAFLKEEILEKDDAWNCPKCKTRRKATKRLSIARLPPILLIHLKRFSFKGPFSDKLETFVQYPIYGLDLSSYVPPPLNNNNNLHTNGNMNNGYGGNVDGNYNGDGNGFSLIYDLYAVCNHFGSLSSGHYTAFVRSQKDWYNIGDSRVSKTDEKSVKARSAYLLCLRRRDQ